MKMDQRILIVDDEAAISWALKMALSEEGYTVVVKNSADDAIAEFKKAPFDMLITDMRMPEKSGIDVIREVKEVSPHVKSMVMTAYPSLDTALDALRLKVDEYIQKPFEVDNVKTLIKGIMATEDAQETKQPEVIQKEEDNKDSAKELKLRMNYLKRNSDGAIVKEIDFFDSEDYLISIKNDLEEELSDVLDPAKSHASISAVLETIILLLGLKSSEQTQVSLSYSAKNTGFEATVNVVGIDSAHFNRVVVGLNEKNKEADAGFGRELLVVKGLSDKIKAKKTKGGGSVVFKIRNLG